MIIRKNICYLLLKLQFVPINLKFEKQVNGYNFKLDHFNYHLRRKFMINRTKSFDKAKS